MFGANYFGQPFPGYSPNVDVVPWVYGSTLHLEAVAMTGPSASLAAVAGPALSSVEVD